MKCSLFYYFSRLVYYICNLLVLISIYVSHALKPDCIVIRSIGHDKKLTRAEWKVDTTGTTMPFLRSLKCQIPSLHSALARKLHERIAFPLSFKPESIAYYLWPVVDHYHSNIEYVQLNARSYSLLWQGPRGWQIMIYNRYVY